MNLRFSLIRNLAIVAGLVVAVCLLAPFAIVPAGYRGVMTTFGKVDQQVYGEGLHMRWPIAQAMHLIDVRIQKGEGEGEAASKDLQVVHTKVAVNYHLKPEHVATAFREVGDLQAV